MDYQHGEPSIFLHRNKYFAITFSGSKAVLRAMLHARRISKAMVQNNDKDEHDKNDEHVKIALLAARERGLVTCEKANKRELQES